MDFVAHKSNERYHKLKDHSQEAAQYAEASLESIGMGKTGCMCGLIHDMGKYTVDFQNYIKNANGKSVIHTFQCEQYMHKFIDANEGNDLIRTAADVIGYAASAHHGLYNIYDTERTSQESYGIEHRYNGKSVTNYDECEKNFFSEFSKDEIDNLFKEATKEISAVIENVDECCDNILPKEEQTSTSVLSEGSIAKSNTCTNEKYVWYGLLERLVVSATMNGDCRSTKEFYEGLQKENIGQKEIWESALRNVNDFVNKKPNKSQVDIARKGISESCEKAAEDTSDQIRKFYAPTGAGKTLSVLRYMLKHAAKTNKKRIIIVVPLLTITEQNAKEIREAVGRELNRIILEYHSDVVIEKNENGSESENLKSYHDATELLNAPIIITTMAQFLNILFSSKKSNIRKMQAFIDSEIAIDEIQTLPIKTTYMATAALNFLRSICKCNIILSSATQPDFGNMLYPIKFAKEPLIKSLEKHKEAFDRVEIYDRTGLNARRGIDISWLVNDAKKCLKETNTLLIICNTKKMAEMISRKFEKDINNTDNQKIYCLTTNLCPRHREDKIADLKTDLENARNNPEMKVICVATQLIEAGVNVSFGCVIRTLAGFDHIVQAAGRCNRNGEKGKKGKLYIYKLKKDEENVSWLPDIQREQSVMNDFLGYNNFPDEPLNIEESINEYYERLKKNIEGDKVCQYKYPLYKNKEGKLQKYFKNYIAVKYLFDFIGNCTNCNTKIQQEFKTAGDAFSVFDNETTPVIVPYGEQGKALIENLNAKDISNADWKKYIEEAKHYSVDTYVNVKDLNLGSKLVKKIVHENMIVYVCDERNYNPQYGITIEG